MLVTRAAVQVLVAPPHGDEAQQGPPRAGQTRRVQINGPLQMGEPCVAVRDPAHALDPRRQVVQFCESITDELSIGSERFGVRLSCRRDEIA